MTDFVSASDNIGPHLLGRIPATDARDWSLEEFLAGGPSTPLDVAFAALLRTAGANPAVKSWIKAAQPLVSALQPAPAPAPTPTPGPPITGRIWGDADGILDQGQTPHCIGFGGAQWGNTLPVDDKFTNADGDRIYYEAKVVDGEPKQEDGSSVHTLAKVLQTEKRLSTYAWATTTDAITAYILGYGPVIVGTDWTNDMFNPDGEGFISPSGGVAGGHCFNLVGYTPDAGRAGGGYYTIRNSWGAGWGAGGEAKITVADFASLLASQGEALCSLELAA